MDNGGVPIKKPSAVLKRGYTDEEVAHIYELGRFFLENGDIHRASHIFTGLLRVAPEFSAGWLGSAYVAIQNSDIDTALGYAQHVLQIEPDSVVAMLYITACSMTLGDYNSAGSYLGEIGEQIDAGAADDPAVKRLYESQLARYQYRSG